MDKNSAIEILKEAILLEQRGKAFYSSIAAKTDSEAVKRIFSIMAEEEDMHIEFLSSQFANYDKTKAFLPIGSHKRDPKKEVVKNVLTNEMVGQITAASFEAAAISAAMDFETRAINLYSERAKSATDTNEKELYQMLSNWESGHHKWLAEMDKELRDQVWSDNNFWPF